jgi:hypothetical protein
VPQRSTLAPWVDSVATFHRTLSFSAPLCLIDDTKVGVNTGGIMGFERGFSDFLRISQVFSGFLRFSHERAKKRAPDLII